MDYFLCWYWGGFLVHEEVGHGPKKVTDFLFRGCGGVSLSHLDEGFLLAKDFQGIHRGPGGFLVYSTCTLNAQEKSKKWVADRVRGTSFIGHLHRLAAAPAAPADDKLNGKPHFSLS